MRELFELLDPPGDNCKSQIYKAQVSNYIGKKGPALTVRLIIQKRKSCPGCNECYWIYDAFNEVCNDWPIINLNTAEDGKYYTISACNESIDWESGIVDSYDLILIPHTGEGDG